MLFRSLALRYDPFIGFPVYSYLIEVHGDMPKALQLLEHHEKALHSYARAAPPSALEPALYFTIFAGATVGLETDCLHALGASENVESRLVTNFTKCGPSRKRLELGWDRRVHLSIVAIEPWLRCRKTLVARTFILRGDDP